MDAKQCDRCEQFYAKSTEACYSYIQLNGRLSPCIELDLCPNCISNLLHFLNLEQKAKDHDKKFDIKR